LRYGVLFGLIGAALLGVNLSGWVDPLVLGTRALSVTIAGVSDWGMFVAVWVVPLLAIGLTLIAPRFWCRVLCPLGAALSLVARWAPLRRRVSNRCGECGACSPVCPTGASGNPDEVGECLVCGRCAAACPRGAVVYGFGRSRSRAEPVVAVGSGLSRRCWLFGVGGLLTGMTLGYGAGRKEGVTLLRPPGSVQEGEFAGRCIGCGLCVTVCPTGGLVPTLRSGPLGAAFGPEFRPRLGGCLIDCNACGNVCPTGAIALLTMQEKREARIGLAVIDQDRCLPWVRGERCVICLDVCPPELGAIELRPGSDRIFRPHVLESRCNGCGLCEQRCPVGGLAAIRVEPMMGPSD
jgi:MauM/NapG family ferredoxin protein